MKYTPDVWRILKFQQGDETFYKVLAGWYGGFTGGNSWKLNSGIKEIIEHPNYYDVVGYSGSVYQCNKSAEKFSGYTMTIYRSIEESLKGIGATVEVVDINEVSIGK